MSLLDDLLKKLGIRQVTCGEINEQIARESEAASRKSLVRIERSSPQDILITEEYENILELIEANSPITLVTGKAGTGKSTLIRWLQGKLTKQFAVVAPTGIAALNAGGQTIHSFCRFPPKDVLDRDDIKLLLDRKLYNKLDLLIIDEVSMVRCDVMDGIDRFLRLNRSSSLPFGGVQILLVGDLFQLPPVVRENPRKVLAAKGYHDIYFSGAFCLKNAKLTPVDLSKVFRQKDEAFIELLNKIRLGEDLDSAITQINDRCSPTTGNTHDIVLTCRNNLADLKNIQKLDELKTPEYLFEGVFKGEFKQMDNLPVPIILKLKKGARVMFVKNDEEGRWVNGSIGVACDVAEKRIRVELANGVGICDVQPVTWEKYKYVYRRNEDKIIAEKIGEYSQYPLILAWAISIHKSQGQTFGSCFIDFGQDAPFAFGQTYVALSRCRSISGIGLGRPLRTTDVKCDPVVKDFYKKLFPGYSHQ